MRDVGCVKSDGLGSTGKHANRTDRFNTLVKQNWWKYALFADAILLTIAIASHEPWEDELQAWLLARDSTPITLPTATLNRLRGWHAR